MLFGAIILNALIMVLGANIHTQIYSNRPFHKVPIFAIRFILVIRFAQVLVTPPHLGGKTILDFLCLNLQSTGKVDIQVTVYNKRILSAFTIFAFPKASWFDMCVRHGH